MSEALYRDSRLELSCGTTIAAEIGRAVVDPKLEVSLQWHGIDCTI